MVWKVILWALELIVTAACFTIALLIVVCFLRPDLALLLLTQLPSYLEAAQRWLSGIFLSAGLSLTCRPVVVSTPALAIEEFYDEREDNEEVPTVLPPPSPVMVDPSSTPQVYPRSHRAEIEPAVIKSAA